MQEVKKENPELINRIATIVEKLIKGSSLYQVKLKKEEMEKKMVDLFGEFQPEELSGLYKRLPQRSCMYLFLSEI